MHHLVLLGDSVLDNGAYTEGGPAVLAQVQAALPNGWRASLNAVDGSTTEDVAAQLSRVPTGATHLLLSVGGNDAILCAEVLESPVSSSGEALLMLADAVARFEASYRSVIEGCLRLGLPLVVCTVYHGNFPEPSYQRRVIVALAAFNDVIIRVAVERNLKVIDLRFICSTPGDYANPIEPSVVGGAKISQAIARAVGALPGISGGAIVVAA
jgi:hypothetical protein